MLHTPSLSYCATLIRDTDHDRYLCALFAPSSVREAWFALFAFNHEIAAIPEIVSEEMIGFMRFAWWREALDEIYAGGPVRKHPVVEALAEIVKSLQLPRAPLDAMIEARQEYLADEGFTQTAQWAVYFKASSASLLELCAHAAKAVPTDALHDLGIAWASVGMARLAQQKKDALQADMFMEIAVSHLKNNSENLPEYFLPFRQVTKFYLKRLKAGKPTGREARFALVTMLLWKRLVKRLS